MKKLILFSFVLVSFCFKGVASGDVVIDSLGDNINQANLTADVGQTFTTGVLSEALLDSIVLGGPQSAAGGSVLTFGLEISIDTDGNHATWDPGVVLGEVGPLTTAVGTNTSFDFSSLGIILADNTVYAIRITDGAGNSSNARFGLSNGAAGGTGGSPPGAFADGTLFNLGSTVFGDGFDAAIQVNTTAIPEPSMFVLSGALLAAVGLRRRRR